MDRNISTFKQLCEYCVSSKKNIYEIAQYNMAKEADISENEVRNVVMNALKSMKEAISTSQTGLTGSCPILKTTPRARPGRRSPTQWNMLPRQLRTQPTPR